MTSWYGNKYGSAFGVNTMVLVNSNMLALGTSAPDFRLPNTEGRMVSLSDYRGAPALLVIFMCNHCPYVKHIRKALARLAGEYQTKGVAIVGINSNDVKNYPDDHPDKMSEEVADVGYTFDYLYDESQEVAKAYSAACTPDFFLFDRGLKLAYRGQFDDSRPGNNQPITGADLRAALNTVLAGGEVPELQMPSVGCNIKWKPGNEPDYFKQ